MRARILAALAGALALVSGAAVPAAQAASDQQEIVTKAQFTVERMLGSPDLPTLKRWVSRSKAVLVVPSLLKAGFIIGGSGGDGVLLSHRPDGTWGPPAFYRVWSASIGAQIGVQDSQVMFVVMTQSGLDAVLSGKIKLGADASIAVGPEGAGVEGATTVAAGADIYSYALNRGAFAGVSFAGAFMQPLGDWNRAYYGRAISAHDIVLNGTVHNPNADGLRRALQMPHLQGAPQPAAAAPAPAPARPPAGVQPETMGRSPDPGPVTQQPLPSGQ